MATDKRTPRQEAVATQHRDMSSEAINFRIQHATTLIAMYENQRARNQRLVSEATSDTHTCERMIEELTNDVATFRTLIRARRG